MSNRILSWLILTLLALTWGSSYILIKKGLVAFPPEQLASLRISISALAFLPILLFRWKKVDWSRWRALLVVGLAGSGFPAILFALAQTKLSSSLTGVLSSLTPLFTLLLAVLFFNVPFMVRKLFGVLIGLGGASLLILFGSGNASASNSWPFALLVLLACCMYALSSNTVKTYLQEMPSLTLSSVAFSMIGPPALFYLWTTDFPTRLSNHPEGWTSLGYICILSLAGTVIASILFFKLVQIKDAIFASTVSYLIPLVAIAWGLLDGEPITLYHFLGMVLILGGVYLTKR